MNGSIGRNAEHRRLRELLGSHALGHLPPAEDARVRAHVDGCAACRADLAEIEPLAGLLAGVDVRHFDEPASPPSDLGALIRAQVADERSSQEDDDLALRREHRRRRASTRAGLGIAAAAVVVAALVGGIAVGRSTVPEVAAPVIPFEPVALTVGSEAIEIETAGLVPHTWGVELRMTGSGFTQGARFKAYFRNSRTGRLQTAGAFVGTGSDSMVCNLQSALMRNEASEVVVKDASGAVVLAANI
ncbi:zf-HC2 domain-containing protein [Nocardioides sp.]|uniref:zf-HC2 domain-containing protein n=1 Tax=Nocardioides sp. TaxID=35761 RepID=UPI002B272321|nr:zf-HC2 domain-containing protein [Nocardioides sp.]